MLKALGKWLRTRLVRHKARQQRRLDWEDARQWVNIGGRSIPRWVRAEIKRFEKRNGGTSSLGLLHFITSGRHFHYRVSFSGQGGPIVHVERSPRVRKGQNKGVLRSPTLRAQMATVIAVLMLAILLPYPAIWTGWISTVREYLPQQGRDSETLYLTEPESELGTQLTPSGGRTLESTTEQTTPARAATPPGWLIFEGETDTELARRSMDIIGRVWKGMEVDKDLTVTYTDIPFYYPETDTYDVIAWDESLPGVATITIPGSPNELSLGTVYASTFMVLALHLAENPSSLLLEKLQAIYAYATEAEYAEVLRCSDELELIYCEIFIASYLELTTPSIQEAPYVTDSNGRTLASTIEPTPELEQIRKIVHRLVNRQRGSPVRRDTALDRRAQQWVGRISHSTLNSVMASPTQTYHSPEGWYPCAYYLPDWAGENLTWQHGYRNVGESAIESWVSSPLHYKFMMHPNHRRMGVGVGEAADGSIIVALAMCS